MSDMWSDIAKFHQKFSLPQEEVPSFPNDEMMAFRIDFMQEELNEFREAVEKRDIVMAFDALLDLAYVTLGTAYLMHLPWNEGWEHVQAANMEKVRAKKAADSTRGSAYDVVKPPGWVPPNRMLHAEVIMLEHEVLVVKSRTVGRKFRVGVDESKDESEDDV